MNLIGGMDEAGLGPILGPLTIGGTLMELPDPTSDPYQLLGEIVTTRRQGKNDERLLVADSKRIFSGPKRWEKLERTALAFMALAWGAPPTDVADLSRQLIFGGDPEAQKGAPWLEDKQLELPCWVSPEQVELDTYLLNRCAEKGSFALRKLALGALHPAPFNAHVRETNSKSATHFHWLMKGLAVLLREGPELVVLDRTGALTNHANFLARAFPGVGVTRTHKEKKEQHYLLRRGSGHFKILFREKAEDSSFAVALAACLAKYVREVFMECQNQWFSERQPGLKPTLGYYVDGKRFLDDAQGVIKSEAIAHNTLIRSR